jgi:comEA protein
MKGIPRQIPKRAFSTGCGKPLHESFMRGVRILQEYLGFTRTEIVVVLFLGATFAAGSAIRLFRSGGSQYQTGEPVYTTSDSLFLARSRLLSGQADSGRGRSQDSAAPLQRISVNGASAAELERLPGIGPALAQRIIAYRETYGSFRSFQDLGHVKGIGPRTLDRLRPLVSLSPQSREHPMPGAREIGGAGIPRGRLTGFTRKR